MALKEVNENNGISPIHPDLHYFSFRWQKENA
jgi:hypothetical protein